MLHYKLYVIIAGDPCNDVTLPNLLITALTVEMWLANCSFSKYI